jgi:hypothetical protein
LIESYQRMIKNFVLAQSDYLNNNVVDAATSHIWRNSLKIMVFFTEWIVESCLNQTKAKKKEIKKARRKIKPENTGVLNKENEKNRSKSKKNLKGILDSANKNRDHDVEIRKEEVTALNPESILKSFSKLVNLELKYLFRNKIVEEDFMNSLIKICFDLLELSNENRDTNDFRNSSAFNYQVSI